MKGYLVIFLFLIPLGFCMDSKNRLSKKMLFINSSDKELAPLLADPHAVAQDICRFFFRPHGSIHIQAKDDEYEERIIKKATLIIESNQMYKDLLKSSLSAQSQDAEDLSALKKTIFNKATRNVYDQLKQKQRIMLLGCGCLQIVTAVFVSLVSAGITTAAFMLQGSYN